MHNQKSHMVSPATLNASVMPSAPMVAPVVAQVSEAVRRITSATLMQGRREVEIEHSGKIYRLRVTQLNKLILTA